jgi:hypothetical protein
MKTFCLSVTIGKVLAETDAAQGQTEEAQAQTEVFFVPEERDSRPPFWPTSSALAAPSSPRLMFDDSRELIHKEVLMQMLGDYEIRSETLRLGDVLTKTNPAQLTTATQRRKQ